MIRSSDVGVWRTLKFVAAAVLLGTTVTAVASPPPHAMKASKRAAVEPADCLGQGDLVEEVREALSSCLQQQATVACVAKTSASLVDQRLITDEERQAVLVCVSESAGE